MKIIETYILRLKEGTLRKEGVLRKVHKLENGRYFVEISDGTLYEIYPEMFFKYLDDNEIDNNER
jgi:hypothetical protein